MSNTTIKLDHATQLALPLAEIEAEAQFRFAFRLENGEEEWLLARLVLLEGDYSDKLGASHGVVLRPENAEPERIFVVTGFYLHKELSWLMSQVEAQNFKWNLFEIWFSDRSYPSDIERFLIINENYGQILLSIRSGFYGEIRSFLKDKEQCRPVDGWFRWEQNNVSNQGKDLQFFRTTDADLNEKILALWHDEDTEIRFAAHWLRADFTEKRKIAFECRNGTWDELKKIALLVLQVRLSNEREWPEEGCRWCFVDQKIGLDGFDQFHNDENLFQWRLTLLSVFQPKHIDKTGFMSDKSPACLAQFISRDGNDIIYISPPTQHDIIEANLQLREWVEANLTREETAKLGF